MYWQIEEPVALGRVDTIAGALAFFGGAKVWMSCRLRPDLYQLACIPKEFADPTDWIGKAINTKNSYCD